jgi:hypothetical protein
VPGQQDDQQDEYGTVEQLVFSPSCTTSTLMQGPPLGRNDAWQARVLGTIFKQQSLREWRRHPYLRAADQARDYGGRGPDQAICLSARACEEPVEENMPSVSC